MSSPREYPWTLHLVWKLLHDDPGALSLFAANPFPGRSPRHIRAVLYRYTFAAPGAPLGRWWDRQQIGVRLPPLETDTPGLRRFLEANGWVPPEGSK